MCSAIIADILLRFICCSVTVVLAQRMSEAQQAEQLTMEEEEPCLFDMEAATTPSLGFFLHAFSWVSCRVGLVHHLSELLRVRCVLALAFSCVLPSVPARPREAANIRVQQMVHASHLFRLRPLTLPLSLFSSSTLS